MRRGKIARRERGKVIAKTMGIVIKRRTKIIFKGEWQIHEKLGMGSIGPATAAAGPLMEEKKQKLAKILEIRSKDII